MDHISMYEFINNINKSELRRKLIPMEMASGWPSISIKNGQICIMIPYYRTQPSNEGKVLIFPIAYTMTFTWPSAKMVEFKTLRFQKEFANIDYKKPVGTFKHDAVKNLTKSEYIDKRDTLFSLYDEILTCIIDKKEFTREQEMKDSFKVLMEPSLYPMYMEIANKFFGFYCDNVLC